MSDFGLVSDRIRGRNVLSSIPDYSYGRLHRYRARANDPDRRAKFRRRSLRGGVARYSEQWSFWNSVRLNIFTQGAQPVDHHHWPWIDQYPAVYIALCWGSLGDARVLYPYVRQHRPPNSTLTASRLMGNEILSRITTRLNRRSLGAIVCLGLICYAAQLAAGILRKQERIIH